VAPNNAARAWGRPERHANVIERLGALILGTAESFGRDAILLARCVLWFPSILKKRAEILRQMSICGVMSFPVVLLVSIFSGAVLALQAGLTLRAYGIEAKVGSVVAASMVCEMGPLGRPAFNGTASLGHMRDMAPTPQGSGGSCAWYWEFRISISKFLKV
jgi:ABC-type transporter Mla maintaining outer membrane lipid asymmetry permease subunit MlaE